MIRADGRRPAEKRSARVQLRRPQAARRKASRARAQRMPQISDQAGEVLPLATGELGREIHDFGTARADLREQLARR